MRRWTPWVLAALIGIELAVSLVFHARFITLVAVSVLAFVAITGVVGLVLCAKLARHRMGWLLMAISLCFATGAVALTHVEVALRDQGGMPPVGPWAVWLGNWSFGIGTGIAATYMLLLFPTGRLPSPRWKPVGWGAGVGLLSHLVGVTFSSETFEGLPIENPIALGDSSLLLLGLERGGFSLLMISAALSVASLLLRYRGSVGLERQQVKWVALGTLVVGVGLVGPLLLELANGPVEVSADFENLTITVALGFIPVTIGIAILRYRLYDIDRIISRTVSYALVAGLLGLVFAAGAVWLPARFAGGQSDLFVAASTLAVAALFNPLRQRIQGVVDRRFNRSRYDAERVIESFTGALRDRVDPASVVDGWVGVVSATMQPSAATVWVREQPGFPAGDGGGSP